MMTLKITERMGHFNLIDPSEESCSMHFVFTEGEEKKYLNLSFDCEQGYNGYFSSEDAADLIDAWDKRVWISSNREAAHAFKELVLSKAADIEIGNREAKRADLQAQRDRIDKKLAELGSLEISGTTA